MSIKAAIIIFILSLVVTYASSFITSLFDSTLLGGEAGFPFKFSSATLFGRGSIDYVMMFANIIFWFFLIFIIWKLFAKKLNK